MIRAVIWDMDGVLIDACEIHREAFYRAVFQVTGRILSDAELDSVDGRPTRDKLRLLSIDDARVEPLKQRMTAESIDAYPLDSYRQFMMSQLGVKHGCYTNSIRRTAESFLSQAGLRGHLECLVTNEDVGTAKPSPEGYLRAMQILGVKPSETLIVEDSPVGLEAARCSGARVLQTTFNTLTLSQVQEAMQCNF